MKPVAINLGCGFDKLEGMINVDAFAICKPDILWDLNETPFPFDDDSADVILAKHVFEHLEDWWPAFCECGRILKYGGHFEIRVPDESSTTALTYRDHHHVFSRVTFHGADPSQFRSATNAWAATELGSVPLRMIGYQQVPFSKYNWMRFIPGLLRFCSDHMRNFIWEQRFVFTKIGGQ